MDEKIEEMAKAIEYAINNNCKLNNGKSCGDCIFDNNGDWNCQNILVATHLFDENYRKESDTAREICLKIIKGQPQPIKEKWVEWFKKEYGVDLGE